MHAQSTAPGGPDTDKTTQSTTCAMTSTKAETNTNANTTEVTMKRWLGESALPFKPDMARQVVSPAH